MLLIVDDDPGFLHLAEKLLPPGRGVLFAGDAKHAKELMATVGDNFSCVMVDLDLPGQDGFSLIQEFHGQFPDLPIIAISAVFEKNILEIATLVGASDALEKPISPEWTAVIARARAKSARA